MTTTTKREWFDAETRDWDGMAETTGRWLWVDDGQVAHHTWIGNDAVADALGDYASTYQCGPQKITVGWWLFLDGEEAASGHYNFTVA